MNEGRTQRGASEAKDYPREAVEREMEEFLRQNPQPDPGVEDLRSAWNALVQPQTLIEAEPAELRTFLRSSRGGSPGNQQTFNQAWKELGDEAAAKRVKAGITYLLYGPERMSLERRLNDLLADQVPEAFPGLKEGLLTKVLAMAFLDRFLPILYLNHRRALLEDLWGINLTAEGPSTSKGELMVRSNDAILELLSPKFVSLEHAAGFLWPKVAASLGRTGGGKGTRGSGKAADRRSFICTNCHLMKPLLQLEDAENVLCSDCR